MGTELRQDNAPAVELITPRGNTAATEDMESLLASLPLGGPIALEIEGSSAGCRFVMRTESVEALGQVAERVAVVWPQAELRHFQAEDDPAEAKGGECVAGVYMKLRSPDYLPLRTFVDTRSRDTGGRGSDPLVGLLGSMRGLPEGYRALAQLVLAPAPRKWAREVSQLARELEAPPRLHREEESRGLFVELIPIGALLLAVLVGPRAYELYTEGRWSALALPSAGAILLLLSLALLIGKLRGAKLPPDPILVREKLRGRHYSVGLRLLVFAPNDASPDEIGGALQRVTAAYAVYDSSVGNGLERRRLASSRMDPNRLDSAPMMGVLSTYELAGMWHLPRMESDVSLVERTGARRRLPLPASVSGGCRIGVSRRQGNKVEVCLPDDMLRRHTLVIGKPRSGKSSVVGTIARHLMERPGALLVVDPHSDLARDIAAGVPERRREDVVYLDASNGDQPFGLNLLDTELWKNRDLAVSSALLIFKYEFGDAWGKRMEDVFNHALHALYSANETICGSDPAGRGRQYTILDVATLLNPENVAYRESVLSLVRDAEILKWWREDYAALSPQQQRDHVHPVQSKIHAYSARTAARLIVGQPRSTVDPGEWLHAGSVVLVDTAEHAVGEDTASLIGATLLNLTALKASQQGGRVTSERKPVHLIVDEFHSIPGAQYERILTGLAKHGVSLCLITQSLERLLALDRASGRALVGTAFSGVDQLFAFRTSGEDARYLTRELGDEVDEQDLLELRSYHCYARLVAGDRRLPTFSVQLDPPPPTDHTITQSLARNSALRYGRNRAAVERDRELAIGRAREARVAALQENRSRSTLGEPIAGAFPGTLVRQPDRDVGPRGKANGTTNTKPNRRAGHRATVFGPEERRPEGNDR